MLIKSSILAGIHYIKQCTISKSAFIHTSIILRKAEDRKEMLASLPAKDEGTIGEKSVDIDTLFNR